MDQTVDLTQNTNVGEDESAAISLPGSWVAESQNEPQAQEETEPVQQSQLQVVTDCGTHQTLEDLQATIRAQVEEELLPERRRLQELISKLEKNDTNLKEVNKVTVQEIDKCRRERDLVMRELGTLQTEFGLLHGRYEVVQRLYQEARDSSYDEQDEKIKVSKSMYQQIAARLRALEGSGDTETKELRKEVKQLKAVTDFQDSEITNLKEENFRLAGSNAQLLRETSKCFRLAAKATKNSDTIDVMQRINDLTRSQLEKFITASSTYSSQYANLALERERAKWAATQSESQAREYQELLKVQEEHTRIKTEKLTEAESSIEALREDSIAQARILKEKCEAKEQEIAELKAKLEHGLDKRTKSLLEEQNAYMKRLNSEKRQLEGKVMSLSAALQLRQMFEVRKWVGSSLGEKEAKEEGGSQTKASTKESGETAAVEGRELAPDVAKIPSIYQWIREREVEWAADEARKRDASEDQWEDVAF